MTVYDIHETTPLARGEALGVLSQQAIKDFLNDEVAQINKIRNQPSSRDKLLAQGLRYFECLQYHLPDLAEEVRGLAHGADISISEAMLLQCRRELIGWGEDCTLLASRCPEHGAYIAQTIDLAGDLAPYIGAVRYRCATRDGGSIAIWNYCGLLGYIGINSHGLAIGINMVLAANWRVGIPPYLLVRHLLTLATIDECLREIERLPRASSRSFLIAEGPKLLNVEMTVDQYRCQQGAAFVHSNHYLDKELKEFDLLQDSRSSLFRHDRMHSFIRQHSFVHSSMLPNFLSDHEGSVGSVCFHTDNLTRGHTVSAAILLSQERRMKVSFGPPCCTPFVNINLN